MLAQRPREGGAFDATLRVDGDTTVLALAGELDLAGAPLFARSIDAATAGGIGSVVVDFAELEFLDLTGVRMIRDLRQRLQADGRDLGVRRARPQARRVFELCQMASWLQD